MMCTYAKLPVSLSLSCVYNHPPPFKAFLHHKRVQTAQKGPIKLKFNVYTEFPPREQKKNMWEKLISVEETKLSMAVCLGQ